MSAPTPSLLLVEIAPKKSKISFSITPLNMTSSNSSSMQDVCAWDKYLHEIHLNNVWHVHIR